MKSIKIIVIVFVLTTLLVIFLPSIIVDKAESKYETMQAKIDSLLIVNDSLYREFNILDSLALLKQGDLVKEKEKIIYIKAKTNEEIQIINVFDNDKLFLFFTNTAAYSAEN